MEELKAAAAVMLLVLALPIVVGTVVSVPFARDVAMFLVVFGSTMSGLFDVSIAGRQWYRGTSRGMDLSWVDIVTLGLILAMLIKPRKGEARFYVVAGTIPFAIYFLYLVMSVLISTPKLFAMYELTKALSAFNIMIAVALYLRSERELKIVLWALMLATCYEGLSAIKGRYIDHQHRVQGNFEHSNMLSMYMCMTVPVAMAVAMSNLSTRLRQVAVLGIAVGFVSVLLTISRTGVMTLIVLMFGMTVAFATFKITIKRMLIGVISLALVLGGLAKAWTTLASRFGQSSLAQEYAGGATEGRGYYIRLAKLMVADYPLGVGLNLWSYYVTNGYGERLGFPHNHYSGTDVKPDQRWIRGSIDLPQAAPAHSLAALTVGELGWPGLFLFGIVWFRWFHIAARFLWPRSAAPTQRIGAGVFFSVFGVFMHSLTEWEYRATSLLFTFHVILGISAGLYQMRKVRRRTGATRSTEPTAPVKARAPVPVVVRRRDFGA